MTSIWHLIIPGFRVLDRNGEREAHVRARRMLGWRFWTLIAAISLAGGLTAVRHLRGSASYTGVFMWGSAATGLFAPPLLLVGYRRALRKACREILEERGEPICTACGYNLTGNVSGVCPECGEEAESET